MEEFKEALSKQRQEITTFLQSHFSKDPKDSFADEELKDRVNNDILGEGDLADRLRPDDDEDEEWLGQARDMQFDLQDDMWCLIDDLIEEKKKRGN